MPSPSAESAAPLEVLPKPTQHDAMDALAVAQRERRKRNRVRYKDQERAYRAKNQDKINARQRQWRIDNPDAAKARDRREYHRNRARQLRFMRDYKKRNRAKMNAYVSKKLAADPSFAISNRMRVKLGQTIAGKYSDAACRKYFGCSVGELRSWFASKFKDGMTWLNRGVTGWQIDHIIPCRAFRLTEIAHRAACYHYTNMQPLWAAQNHNKNKAIPEGFNADIYVANFLRAFPNTDLNPARMTPRQNGRGPGALIA